MFKSTKIKKTSKLISFYLSKVSSFRLFAEKWGDYNLESLTIYQATMNDIGSYISEITGVGIDIEDLHEKISSVNISRVRESLQYIESLMIDLIDYPELLIGDDEFFELLSFSLVCNFITGYDGGVIAYSRYNMNHEPDSEVLETFELLKDNEGKFNSNLIGMTEFEKNSWLFRAFTCESDIDYEEYLVLYDFPCDSEQTKQNDIKYTKSSYTSSEIDEEIRSLNASGASSITVLTKTIECLEFIENNSISISETLDLSLSEGVLSDILEFRMEFHQCLRDMCIGISVSMPNNENLILKARNIQLEYQNLNFERDKYPLLS